MNSGSRRVYEFGPWHEMAVRMGYPSESRALADVLGFHPRSIGRWSTAGRVTPETADRLACSIGLHPSLVWPEWFAHAPPGATNLA